MESALKSIANHNFLQIPFQNGAQYRSTRPSYDVEGDSKAANPFVEDAEWNISISDDGANSQTVHRVARVSNIKGAAHKLKWNRENYSVENNNSLYKENQLIFETQPFVKGKVNLKRAHSCSNLSDHGTSFQLENQGKQEKRVLKTKVKKFCTLRQTGIQNLLDQIEVSEISVMFKDPDQEELIPKLERKGSKAQDNWRKLRNIQRAISFFKNPKTVLIQDPVSTFNLQEEIVEQMENYTVRQVEASTPVGRGRANVFKSMRAEEDFFELVAHGGSDLEKLEGKLLADPRRDLHEASSEYHPLNKKNSNMMSPLYVSCLHGNAEAVQLLLRLNANPKLLNCADVKGSGKEEWETLLDVTARWNHAPVMKVLLANTGWEPVEVRRAIKKAPLNSEARSLLISYRDANQKKSRTASCCLMN